MLNNKMILGIDMGGTNLRVGIVEDGLVKNKVSCQICATGTADEVLQQLFAVIDSFMPAAIQAIGIGFPGLASNGIAYDVYNIPSWKDVPLQYLMQQRYKIPVQINNDANCFALGEFYFGKGSGSNSMIGLTIGTGLGTGIIINKQLYTGNTGGAGEFGMMPYKDKYFEYYASGQFFKNIYGIDGKSVYSNAINGDTAALKMYEQLGMHLGNAIINILYAMDVSLIIFGGSVRHAYPLFSKSMWQQLQHFEFKRALKNLKIEISELNDSAVLGAAALHYLAVD